MRLFDFHLGVFTCSVQAASTVISGTLANGRQSAKLVTYKHLSVRSE